MQTRLVNLGLFGMCLCLCLYMCDMSHWYRILKHSMQTRIVNVGLFGMCLCLCLICVTWVIDMIFVYLYIFIYIWICPWCWSVVCHLYPRACYVDTSCEFWAPCCVSVNVFFICVWSCLYVQGGHDPWCPKLQEFSCKGSTNYTALLQKMTYKIKQLRVCATQCVCLV